MRTRSRREERASIRRACSGRANTRLYVHFFARFSVFRARALARTDLTTAHGDSRNAWHSLAQGMIGASDSMYRSTQPTIREHHHAVFFRLYECGYTATLMGDERASRTATSERQGTSSAKAQAVSGLSSREPALLAAHGTVYGTAHSRSDSARYALWRTTVAKARSQHSPLCTAEAQGRGGALLAIIRSHDSAGARSAEMERRDSEMGALTLACAQHPSDRRRVK